MTISADFRSLCKQLKRSPATIRGKDRRREIVKDRREIAKALALKYSYTDIGKVMWRNHSSVIYLVKDDFAAQKKANGKAAYDKIRVRPRA